MTWICLALIVVVGQQLHLPGAPNRASGTCDGEVVQVGPAMDMWGQRDGGVQQFTLLGGRPVGGFSIIASRQTHTTALLAGYDAGRGR